MTDFTKTTNFTAKDNLTTGDALKVIKGAYFDTEYDNIATAITSKYDSNDLASQAQAEAGTNNLTLMTPLRAEQHVQNWAGENDAMVEDIQALNLSADALLGWDQSATAAIGFTLGAGLSFSTTTLNLASAVAGAGMTMTSQVLNVIGGDGITANANDVALTASAATTTNPCEFISGKPEIDLAALTTIEGNALAATDTFLVDDGGTPKGIEYQDMGFRPQLSQTSQTLAAADMNTIMEFNGTATLTLPSNASVALPKGAAVIVATNHATQQVTVDAASGVILHSVFHPGGSNGGSDKVRAGGVAVVIKIDTDDWYVSGDTVT